MGDTQQRKAFQPANRLADKVVIITGASRGIGLAVATAVAAEGANVAVCARDREEIEAARKKILHDVAEMRQAAGMALTETPAVVAEVVDVTHDDDVQAFVQAVHDRFSRLDAAINNAGLSGPKLPLARMPASLWNEVIGVNLTGSFLVAKAAAKLMKPRGTGSIVNVSADAGRESAAGWGAYGVSKWGIEGLTRTLADEMAACNVRVNCVNPGPTRTRLRAEAFPQEDFMTIKAPEAVVPVFVWLCSDASIGTTGQSLNAEGFDLSLLDAAPVRADAR